MPGLADMDVYLQHSGAAHAERTLFLLLANGVTTIRNIDGGHPDGASPNGWVVLDGPSVLRLRARAAAGELLSPRIYASANWRLDSTQSIDANVAAYKAAGYDFIAAGRVRNAAALDSLTAAARRVGLPIGGGMLSLGPENALLVLERYTWAGVDLYPEWFGFAPADTMKLGETAAAAARAHLWTCIGDPYGGSTRPSALEARYVPHEYHLFWGTPLDRQAERELQGTTTPDRGPRVVKALAGQSRVVRALRDAGAGLLLCSGAMGGGNYGFAVHRELQSFVSLGLTPYQALETGTRNAAAMLGALDSAGTVAQGKRADLLLLNRNPLEDIRRSSDIAGVMIGGRWLPQAEIEQRLEAYYKNVPRGR